jgi:hypothetical protein
MSIDYEPDPFNLTKGVEYFYRVNQYVIAFDKNIEVMNSYDHVQDFKNPNLQEARTEALSYILNRHVTLPEGFIYPFLSPEEHRANPHQEHARYSYSVSLVEWYNAETFYEYSIVGNGSDDENLELEKAVLEKLGYGG